jgi:hypothetical protein
LLFLATAYPLVLFVRADPALSMMFNLYVTLCVFLLLAIRNPSEDIRLITFTAWSSFAHAGVMGFQALRNMISRGELVGSVLLVILGIAFIALAPGKQTHNLSGVATREIPAVPRPIV